MKIKDAWMMVNNKVRRLLVMNRQGHPVGVFSLDDLAFFTGGNETAGRILNALAEKHRP